MCTDTDKPCATASGKNFVCAHYWHVTAYTERGVGGCAFPSFFRPSTVMARDNSNPLLDICLREKEGAAVIFTTLVVESSIFSELLCFFLHDFADPRYGWITRAFPPARKNGWKRRRK